MAKPTHHILMKHKDGDFPGTRIGAAWEQEGGWFNLTLNPGVVLTWKDTRECWVSLSKDDGRPRKDQ